MIIGREFAWAHLPKTGGDATSALFHLFPELIAFAHPRETNDKHNNFRDHADEVAGKVLVMNIRRLPAWILSLSRHQANYGLEHHQPSLESCDGMSKTNIADRFLSSFLAEGRFVVDTWLRTEHLIDDFLEFIGRFTDVTPNMELKIRSVGGVNAMSYDHRIHKWFTPDQIESMYKANPRWRDVEREVYGDSLDNPREVAAIGSCGNLRPRGRIQILKVTESTWSSIDAPSQEIHIEYPKPGVIRETYDIPIRGWVAGDIDCIEIEAIHRGTLLRRCSANHGHIAGERKSGFSMLIGSIGLPPEFKILLRAVLADGRRVELATIEACHVPLRVDYKSSLQPIMLTTRGRSGSSLLMRMLSEHSSVVVDPPHPYETRAAAYWLHMIKVLSDPADHMDSSSPNTFSAERKWVGQNPFYTSRAIETKQGEAWYGRIVPERLGGFCLRSIDDFYRNVASSVGKEEPVYFAEKFHPDHLPWLVWDLYPKAREVVLVRDFRDMISSILAFNKKRGKLGFGRDVASSDLEYVRITRSNVQSFLQSWKLRSDRAFLLRYEDLILKPEDTLDELTKYLGLEADVEKMILQANSESVDLRDHRTTREPSSSIGRWKRDLMPSLQEACQEAFHEALVEFGYE